MLIQIDIRNVPKPYKKSLSENNMVNIDRYLSSFRRVSPYDAINFDNTIQVIVALLYSYNNPEQPINITLPIRSTSIEILNTPLVQMLPSLFKEYRLVINGANINELFVKGLLDVTKDAFRILKENKNIDPCLNALLRGPYKEDFTPINVTAFEIANSDLLQSVDKIALALSNKFFMYLLTQSILNNGFFGLPFYAWNKEEIENENYFKDLKNLFKRVFVIGEGREWKSTHLIVFEPFEDITHCITNNK